MILPLPAGTPNPLPAIARIAGPRGWIPLPEMSLIVAFQMKLVGLDYRTTIELSKIMSALTIIKFIELREDKSGKEKYSTRINPSYAILLETVSKVPT